MITPKDRTSRKLNFNKRACVPVLVRGALDPASDLPRWQKIDYGRRFTVRGYNIELVAIERDDYSWAAIEPRTGLAVCQDCDTYKDARRLSEQRIKQIGGEAEFEAIVERLQQRLAVDGEHPSVVPLK